MLEKMELEKKEKRNHLLRCIFIVILVGMLGIICFCFMSNALISRGTNEVFGWYYFSTMLSAGILIGLLIGVIKGSIGYSKEVMEENIEKIQFNAKVDELLIYLGNGETQVTFKGGMECLPKCFKSVVKIRKRTYFVRKDGMGTLAVSVFKGKKKVDDWRSMDYAFFFRYFEPIFSKKENA